MESQAEKFLTVMMDMVIDGIPSKGGNFEQPIESEARRFLSCCDGIADAAVSAAAYELLVKKPSWSASVWRGTLRAVVGQVPLVGTATAVFTDQFESLWRQLRFVALAATMYGHNPRDEVTQCQILLCLLGDKIVNEQERLGKGIREGTLKFAVTTIAKRMVISQSTNIVMKGALGGLLVGVMPGAVTSIYNIVVLGKRENQEGAAKNATDAVRKVKEHFKMEEQPTLLIAKIAFLAWIVPKVLTQLMRVDRVLFRFLSATLGEIDSLNVLFLWYCIEFVSFILLVLILLKSKRYFVRLGSRHQWLLATVVLYVRAFINFLAVANTANSFAIAILHQDIYNGHRAVVGIFSIICCQKSMGKLKPLLPYFHGSLLVWILYSGVLWVGNYTMMIKELLSRDLSTKTKFIEEILDFHYNLKATGFARNRVHDAVDVISTIALHVLVEQIRRSEIIITLLGPVAVVDGILFAAKSLGNFVVRPEQLLQWLDSASPPPTMAWGIFSAQYSAVFLGALWGSTSATGIMSTVERVLACYAVVVTIPFTLIHQRLPPPYENRTWSQALNSRHRLLFLIPELDSSVLSKLHFVIKFFERYEKAYTQTTNTWTSSVAWFDKKWTSLNVWLRQNVSNRLGNSESECEFQMIRESDVPFKEAVDEDNEDSYYSRFVRHLKKRQHTKVAESLDSLVPEPQLQETITMEETTEKSIQIESLNKYDKNTESEASNSWRSWLFSDKRSSSDTLKEFAESNLLDESAMSAMDDNSRSGEMAYIEGEEENSKKYEKDVKELLEDMLKDLEEDQESSENVKDKSGKSYFRSLVYGIFARNALQHSCSTESKDTVRDGISMPTDTKAKPMAEEGSNEHLEESEKNTSNNHKDANPGNNSVGTTIKSSLGLHEDSTQCEPINVADTRIEEGNTSEMTSTPVGMEFHSNSSSFTYKEVKTNPTERELPSLEFDNGDKENLYSNPRENALPENLQDGKQEIKYRLSDFSKSQQHDQNFDCSDQKGTDKSEQKYKDFVQEKGTENQRENETCDKDEQEDKQLIEADFQASPEATTKNVELARILQSETSTSFTDMQPEKSRGWLGQGSMGLIRSYWQGDHEPIELEEMKTNKDS